MKELVLGNKKYIIHKFTGDMAIKMGLKTIKLLAPIIPKNLDDNNLDFSVFSKIDVDELFKYIKELLQVVLTSDNRILSEDTTLMLEFGDSLENLLPILVEVIKYNNFLSLLGGLQKISLK